MSPYHTPHRPMSILLPNHPLPPQCKKPTESTSKVSPRPLPPPPQHPVPTDITPTHQHVMQHCHEWPYAPHTPRCHSLKTMVSDIPASTGDPGFSAHASTSHIAFTVTTRSTALGELRNAPKPLSRNHLQLHSHLCCLGCEFRRNRTPRWGLPSENHRKKIMVSCRKIGIGISDFGIPVHYV